MGSRSALLIAGSGLALLIAGKFVFLLADNDFDITRAPVAFLLPLGALIFGVALAAGGRRSGIVLIGVVALLMLPVLGVAILNRGLAQQTAADTLLVAAGIPLAIGAVWAAVTHWREHGRFQ